MAYAINQVRIRNSLFAVITVIGRSRLSLKSFFRSRPDSLPPGVSGVGYRIFLPEKNIDLGRSHLPDERGECRGLRTPKPGRLSARVDRRWTPGGRRSGGTSLRSPRMGTSLSGFEKRGPERRPDRAGPAFLQIAFHPGGIVLGRGRLVAILSIKFRSRRDFLRTPQPGRLSLRVVAGGSGPAGKNALHRLLERRSLCHRPG